MALIQVTPELLQEKATEVRTLRSNHDEIITKMRTLVNALNEQWKGEAQDAFVAKFNGMESTFTSFSNLIEGYAELMDKSAIQLQETDQALKSAINSSFN